MNIAILGCGRIAETMATTLQPLKNVTLYAVAARDIERAQIFADKYGFMYAYGSYVDMLLDPQVELVYIATPHSHHYEHIKLCLKHNKHVLCEKAFTANARQAEEVLREAEAKGLLLTEAIWTRYMPMRGIINDVLNSGIIGKPTSLSANLGYPLEHKKRVTDLALCGGALLDVGVYALNFASMVFGNEIESMAATCIKYPTGVDAQETIMLTYKDGRMASLYATMLAQTDRRGVINGTNGYIEIENINNPESIKVYNLERRVIAQYAAPAQVTGYEYEIYSAMNAIYEGRIECPEMTHYETLLMMQLMDNIRGAWNIRFPYEVEKVESDPDRDEVARKGRELLDKNPNAQEVSKKLSNVLGPKAPEKDEKVEGVRLIKETGSLVKEEEPKEIKEEKKVDTKADLEKVMNKVSNRIPGLDFDLSIKNLDENEDEKIVLSLDDEDDADKASDKQSE